MDTLFLNTDNVIELTELTNGMTGDAITNATVTLTLFDEDDVEITGETWPLAMNYVSGTTATYRATASYDIGLSNAQHVKAEIVVDAGVGLHREWIKHCIVKIGN